MRFSFYLLATTLLSLPVLVFAQGKAYSPLVDLSNGNQGNQVQTFEQYISFLYGISIAVAALLAVVKIILAGAKYMLSDVISNKGDALKDIQGAILGLLLIISAVIILELINPALTNKSITFDKFQSARPEIENPPVTTTSGQTLDESSRALAEGVDACVRYNESKVSSTGKTIVQSANASGCPADKIISALTKFGENCIKDGGRVANGGSGSKTVGCEKPIPGAVDASNLAKDIISNASDKKITLNNYISQSGNVITLDLGTLCPALNAGNQNANQQKTLTEQCYLGTGGGNSVSYTTNIKSECAERYGKFETANRKITCKVPTITKSATDFKGYDSNYPNASPTTEADYKAACGKIGGELFDLGQISVSGVADYKCVKY